MFLHTLEGKVKTFAEYALKATKPFLDYLRRVDAAVLFPRSMNIV